MKQRRIPANSGRVEQVSDANELVVPDWDINDFLDIPACSLDEREALEMVR
jgi:hypothetical protein